MRFLYLSLLLLLLLVALVLAEKRGLFVDAPHLSTPAIEEPKIPAGKLDTIASDGDSQPSDGALATAAYLKGWVLMKFGRYAKAIGAFQDFRQDYPSNRYTSNALYWTGEAYFLLGNLQGAVDHFEQLIGKYPNSEKVRDNAMIHLADSYYRLRLKEDAWCVLESYTARFPESHFIEKVERQLRVIRIEEGPGFVANCKDRNGRFTRALEPISGHTSGGSGFLISAVGHIVTAHHVIQNCQEQKIRAEVDYKEYKASIVGVDETNDIAVLSGKIHTDTYLHLSDTDPYLAQDIWVSGFPYGTELPSSSKASVNRGIVSRLTGLRDDHYKLQIDAAIQPGNSGGPIVNESGNVVGIVVSKADAAGFKELWDELPENTNFGVKVSTLKNLLLALELSPQARGDDRISKKELGRQLGSATVYIFCSEKPAPNREAGTREASIKKRG